MTLLSILQYRQDLDTLFSLAQAQTPGDQVQGRLAQYICIRLSGFIDQSLQKVLYEYARVRADPRLARFVSQRLEREVNLSAGDRKSVV